MSIATPRRSALHATLRAHGFAGRVVVPSDAGYDRARACWNGAIDRRPAAVAYATGPGDVSAAIRAARSAGTPFTVRAGAHSVSGRSVRDGALCLDLRELAAIEVDPERAVVRVGGGALLGELDAATQEHGLAVPAGQISHTGVGGLTLGGGLGWLMRRHGLTIDSLLAADVVLADGRIARASADEHPDLFWALRGGGGDFAVVTRFELRAHRVGPAVLAGLLAYPWERAGEVMRAARDLMERAPEELGMFAVLLTAPPSEPFPPELQGRPAAVLGVAWCGDLAEGDRVLAPLRSRRPPALDLVEPMPYVALQSMLDATAPPGLRYHDRLHYLDAVGDELIDTLIATFEDVPTPQSHVITGWMGGAVDRVPPGATAFGHRTARAETWIIGCSGEEPLGPTTDWVRRVWDAAAPHATGGTYVNALAAGRPVREAYAGEVFDRLVAVKRRYDPDGVLSGNGIA
ncbi:MAG TPA: FAD-binding oxidoreductase [Solirubrobacteraceae bacterium]|nr:FAD-binding oxidoreductase [Solirubrobacteraceae bacterium]